MPLRVALLVPESTAHVDCSNSPVYGLDKPDADAAALQACVKGVTMKVGRKLRLDMRVCACEHKRHDSLPRMSFNVSTIVTGTVYGSNVRPNTSLNALRIYNMDFSIMLARCMQCTVLSYLC